MPFFTIVSLHWRCTQPLCATALTVVGCSWVEEIEQSPWRLPRRRRERHHPRQARGSTHVGLFGEGELFRLYSHPLMIDLGPPEHGETNAPKASRHGFSEAEIAPVAGQLCPLPLRLKVSPAVLFCSPILFSRFRFLVAHTLARHRSANRSSALPTWQDSGPARNAGRNQVPHHFASPGDVCTPVYFSCIRPEPALIQVIQVPWLRLYLLTSVVAGVRKGPYRTRRKSDRVGLEIGA